MSDEYQAAHEARLADILAKHTPRQLAKSVSELEFELEMTKADVADVEEQLAEAHQALADVRDQILKGDAEYAVELIGREIGF